jgi:uncharacterized protein (TIGR02266 family)
MVERAVLILDAEGHPLGELSLALIRLGVRPLYTTALDELLLLSREYRSQIGALLVPSEDAVARLPALRKHLLDPLGLSLSSLVPVGSRLVPERADPLRAEGLRFCLPAQPEPHELRYVVASAIAHGDREELRRDPRVPCELPVSVESEHRTVDGALTNLSMGGVFVALANPFPEGAAVRLHLVFGGRTAVVAARVLRRIDVQTPNERDRGMGVSFVDMDEATAEALQGFVDERLRRIRF